MIEHVFSDGCCGIRHLGRGRGEEGCPVTSALYAAAAQSQRPQSPSPPTATQAATAAGATAARQAAGRCLGAVRRHRLAGWKLSQGKLLVGQELPGRALRLHVMLLLLLNYRLLHVLLLLLPFELLRGHGHAPPCLQPRGHWSTGRRCGGHAPLQSPGDGGRRWGRRGEAAKAMRCCGCFCHGGGMLTHCNSKQQQNLLLMQ